MKILSKNFFNKKKNTKNYTTIYKNIDFKNSYPANLKRLEIVKKLLKKYKPKNIVDAGCGTAMPLISIKKLGFNIIGYDKATNMIIEAKKNLKKNNLSENLVRIGDFENPVHIKNNSVDCILGMGTFYYSKKFNNTLKTQIKKLKKKGRIIFSLRNKLFNIATFNNYSIDFFSSLYDLDRFDKKTKKLFLNYFKNFSDRRKNKYKNIDDKNVFSISHNPITIEKELLNKLGLKCNGIYFYHFHALPPMFENLNKVFFRKLSYNLENPKDWRGYFIASAFVLDCNKI